VVDEQSAGQFRERLARERDRLATLRADLDRTEADLADALLDRALGVKSPGQDQPAIDRLTGTRDGLHLKIAEATTIEARLEAHLRTWDGDEARRRHDAAAAELARLAATGRELEAAYAAAAETLAGVAARMTANRQDFFRLTGSVGAYRQAHGLGGWFREPSPPFLIKPGFVRGADPVAALRQWLADWRRAFPS
jgi:hypothetical protein